MLVNQPPGFVIGAQPRVVNLLPPGEHDLLDAATKFCVRPRNTERSRQQAKRCGGWQWEALY